MVMEPFTVFVLYKTGASFMVRWGDLERAMASFDGWCRTDFIAHVWLYQSTQGGSSTLLDEFPKPA